MSSYERGLKYLAKYLVKNDKTVVILPGGSAAYVEADLAGIGCHPTVIKTASRQCLTDYVEDIVTAKRGLNKDIIIVEDHSLSLRKVMFLAEKMPDVDVVSIVGVCEDSSGLPNCRVLQVDPQEARKLNFLRKTSPVDRR